VILRPLADPPSSAAAQPLPIINPTSTGVIRCTSCRAYINPFVQFLGAGAQWRCNLCGFVNDVPQSYFSALDHTGRRADLDQRPELIHGSLEIVAPVDYMVRQPMPPVYFFVIDVSEASVKSGMLQTLCETVMSTLDKLPGDKRTLVGFLTFDSTVHFYSLKSGPTSTPQMFVMSDLDDVFLPQPQDLLVNLDESRSQVEQLVSSLASMHSKTRDVEAALGPALEGALQVMSRIGGKMLVFLSGLPSLGEGRLINRENTRALGTEKEHMLLSTPSVEFYKKHAIKLTKFQICADLFLFHNDMNANASFLDIATLSDLNKLTGGQLYFYPNYSSAQHAKKFNKELTRCLIRTQGWEAVVRVRASKGVRISEFHGNFFMRGADLLALPGIDSDKAFALELKNDESLITNPTISIQAALLYTTSSGERRIRVHTTCIPVTQQLGELFDRVNVNAITNLLAKQAIIGVYKEGFDKAREFVRNRCVALLRTHRTALAKQQAGPSTELNVLPLMTLGLLKNAAFKEGAELRTDARAYLLAAMYTMGIVEMETFVRPRMLPVHDMQDKVGLPKEDAKRQQVMNADGTPAPPPVQTIELPSEAGLTAEVLKSDTVFLVDNGMDFLIRVGRQVSPEWLQSVFGVPTLDSVDSRTLVLQTPRADDLTSPLRRLTNILTYLREVSPLYQQLYIMREGEASELKFFNMLIEDRNMRSAIQRAKPRCDLLLARSCSLMFLSAVFMFPVRCPWPSSTRSFTVGPSKPAISLSHLNLRIPLPRLFIRRTLRPLQISRSSQLAPQPSRYRNRSRTHLHTQLAFTSTTPRPNCKPS
jgi:protein transport protein SEC24